MMMEETMAPMVLGMPVDVALMLFAGIVYFIGAVMIWKPFREERNELIGALLAFLVYQAAAMILMAVGMLNPKVGLYQNLAGLSILLGSVYMLRFPFSRFSTATRRILMTLVLIAAFIIFGYYMADEMRQMQFMDFSIYYDIVVNGVIVGIFMIYSGFKASQGWYKVKAVGGGTGVVSCCIVANVATLSSALALSSVFQFLAPVVIVGSIAAGRRMQKKS